METSQLHRGRLIDHLQLVVRDLDASQDFYSAVLAVLEIPIVGTTEDYFWADELVVSSVQSPAALGTLTGRHHLAFQAKDRTMVDAFYRAALALGGRDNGAPGERSYHSGYYAAFLLDPDGNNIDAVYHGEARRSAPSALIDFEVQSTSYSRLAVPSEPAERQRQVHADFDRCCGTAHSPDTIPN